MNSTALAIGLKLANLNPQQLAKVEKLVDKLSAKAGVQLEEGPVSKGGNNPPNTSKNRPPAPAGSGGEAADVHQIKKSSPHTSTLRKQLADKKISPIKRRGQQDSSDSKTYTRREPIYIGERENKFLELTEGGKKIAESSKEDSEFDRKVWAGHTPVPRGTRQAQIEVECVGGCDKVFEISANYPIPESGYVCNDCIVRKRH